MFRSAHRGLEELPKADHAVHSKRANKTMASGLLERLVWDEADYSPFQFYL